jgi:hypothetical protein
VGCWGKWVIAVVGGCCCNQAVVWHVGERGWLGRDFEVGVIISENCGVVGKIHTWCGVVGMNFFAIFGIIVRYYC